MPVPAFLHRPGWPKLIRCQILLPVTSISPAPAISATSAAIPPETAATVRWRQIFRSNHLGHLTDADVEVLRGLGVKRAFDFRGAEERVAAMCGVADIAVHSLPVEPTVVAALRARREQPARRCHRPTRVR